MGMYDIVLTDDLVCSNCGDTSPREAQTKDLDCYLNVYHIGSIIPNEENLQWLDGSVNCITKKCKDWELEKYKGRILGFGYCWDVYILVNSNNEIIEVTDQKPTINQCRCCNESRTD